MPLFLLKIQEGTMLIHFKNNQIHTIESLEEITKQNTNEIKKSLDLLLSKQILKKRGNEYLLSNHYFVGEIQVKDTFAFLLQETEDIFIPGGSINTAMDKDIVLVKMNKSARVESIIKRATEHVVCVVKKRKKRIYLEPNIELPLPLEVRMKDFIGGEVLYVKIKEYHKHFLLGEVVKQLGFQTDPGMDVLRIIYEKGFPYGFDQETLDEADSLNREIDKTNRFVDDSYLVTIDGEDAKDLDDAVGLFYDGHYHLSVHIADVSHYVKEGSLIDKEAYEKGTSAYLADRVIPMLPRRLSNDLCSLNEGEDRYALSLYITLDDQANILDHSIKETVINVDKRLSYKEVNHFLKGESLGDEQVEKMLNEMYMLASLLEQKRKQRGELEFESIEYYYELDDHYNIIGVHVRKQEQAEKIIESFMILANEIISEHLTRLDLPTIYRIHERPSLEKLNNLTNQLNELDLKVNRPRHFTPKSLQGFLHSIKDNPLETLIHDLVLRSMAKAKYDMRNLGHFGLASPFYSHFTAPIRRYPDLFLHRMIKAYLIHPTHLLESIHHFESIGREVSFHCSEQERLADELSREVDKLKIAQYMEKQIGTIYNAVVSGMIKKGFFVRVDEGIEGMVVLQTTKEAFEFDEKKMTLTSHRRVLKIGSKVKVKLIDVDVKLRQITFELLK